MKRIIISILILTGASLLIAFVLSNNKKSNEEKVRLVEESVGDPVVRIANVSKELMDLSFTSNGNLMASREIDLKAENPGIISSILVKKGDKVVKGQIIATLDDKFLSLNLQTAQDAYQKLLKDKERYESSFETGGITQAQLDDIRLHVKNAENQLKEIQRRNTDTHIRAPFSGIINEKYIEIGDYLNPGTPLFEIVDVSTLKLGVKVNENQVTSLEIGDTVNITIPVFPDKNYSGVVSFISVKADASLNFPIEIKLNNLSDNLIKAGMYATATFESKEIHNSIFISRKAFIGSVNNKEVYTLHNENIVRLTKVTPGVTIGEKVEILEGLKEGDNIVISGQINLKDNIVVEVLQ